MYIVYIIFPCSHSPYLVAFLIHSSYLQGVLEISTDPQISSLPFTYLAISSPRFCTRYLAWSFTWLYLAWSCIWMYLAWSYTWLYLAWSYTWLYLPWSYTWMYLPWSYALLYLAWSCTWLYLVWSYTWMYLVWSCTWLHLAWPCTWLCKYIAWSCPWRCHDRTRELSRSAGFLYLAVSPVAFLTLTSMVSWQPGGSTGDPLRPHRRAAL